jgi:hypothetical protein
MRPGVQLLRFSTLPVSQTLYNIGGIESKAGPVEVTMEKVTIEGTSTL